MPLLGKDGRIETGFVRPFRPLILNILKQTMPKMAKHYAEEISAKTGLPIGVIMGSQPFRNYVRKLKEIEVIP
ncbi:MAG: hypothetical protein QXT26_02695 [Thermoproteota archaeon]